MYGMMQNTQNNYNREMALPCLLSSCRQPPELKLEEEEKRSYDIPDSEEELGDWWSGFNRRHQYPLYCMILATEADTNVASIIDNSREELSIAARDQCCFIYFRDLKRAKLLEAFRFSEHARGVMRFIQLIDIQPNNLPCLLFFERIVEGEYVCLPVGNRTESEIIADIRALFSFIYSGREVSLSTVKAFRFSRQVGFTGKTVGKGIIQLSKDMIIELFKSLAQVP